MSYSSLDHSTVPFSIVTSGLWSFICEKWELAHLPNPVLMNLCLWIFLAIYVESRQKMTLFNHSDPRVSWTPTQEESSPRLTEETVIFLLLSVFFNMYRVPLLSQSLVTFCWESAGFPSTPESPWKETPLLVCTESPTWGEAGQDLNAKFSPDCSPSTLSLPYKSLSF